VTPCEGTPGCRSSPSNRLSGIKCWPAEECLLLQPTLRCIGVPVPSYGAITIGASMYKATELACGGSREDHRLVCVAPQWTVTPTCRASVGALPIRARVPAQRKGATSYGAATDDGHRWAGAPHFCSKGQQGSTLCAPGCQGIHETVVSQR
jgi:hypothetical protein